MGNYIGIYCKKKGIITKTQDAFVFPYPDILRYYTSK